MVRLRIAASALALALMVLLAACDSGTATPTPVPTSTAASSPTATIPGDLVIVYDVSGGIAGRHTRMTISADGTVESAQVAPPSATPTSKSTLPRDRLSELVSKFAAADFFNLNTRYGTNSVADDIYYMVTYTAGGRTKSVTVEQVGGKGLTPPALDSLLQDLASIQGSPTP